MGCKGSKSKCCKAGKWLGEERRGGGGWRGIRAPGVGDVDRLGGS